MATMRGSLETISVAELCMQLGGQAISGTLSLESDGRNGQIAFENGAVVWASSPSRGARIGDRLVHAGLLDPYYVDQAAQAQREAPPGTGLAALLVDRGLVSEDAARLFLQEQMLDSLTELLGWRTGSFDLSNDPPPVVRLAVAVPTESLLTEVRRRLAEQERVRAVVASLDLVPATTAQAPEHLALDESVVLREVDGTRTLTDLASELGFGDNELRRIVYGLTLLDAVTLNGAPVEVAGDPLDEVEHAIEDSLDEALSGSVSEAASDELETVLEGLLAGGADDTTEAETDRTVPESPAPAVADVAEAEVAEAEVAEVEAEVAEPGVVGLESTTTDDVDEPRPWVGYAKARPGTSPPRRAPAPPPSDDLPYVVTAAETSPAAPTPPEEPSPEPSPTEPEPMWTAGTTHESASEDAPEDVDDQPAADAQDQPESPSPSRGGDDLSALLAELSSLSTDDDSGDRPAAPPPRKPSAPSQDDNKDPKKRRLFGR